MSARVGCSARG